MYTFGDFVLEVVSFPVLLHKYFQDPVSPGYFTHGLQSVSSTVVLYQKELHLLYWKSQAVSNHFKRHMQLRMYKILCTSTVYSL